MLCGEFDLSQLQQTLASHPCIVGGQLKHSFDTNRVFEYSFETETGIAVVHVFTFDNNRPDCANKILFKIPVATPPQFISNVIEFLAELTGLSTFSISVYEIRTGEDFSLGWHTVDDVTRLEQEYQEVHKAWRSWAGMPACKTTEMLLPRDCIHTQVRKKQRPVKIFLCPRGSEINFYQLGGFPNVEVRSVPVGKADFYQWIGTIQLDQCRALGIQEKIKMIPHSPNSPETKEIPIEVVQLEVDGSRLELEIHTEAKGQVSWIEYEIEFGIARCKVEQILRCLIEFATKLDWQIIEGLDFQPSDPLDLDIQKLVEFVI
jgi:hypothetical protein